MYKHLFGPVPSRRLGMSLGVDLIPHKICSLNCVYCECGRTTTLTNKRDEYVPTKEVYKELKDFFSNNPDPDYITFSGAGEPTLHVDLGEVIGFLKELRPGVPIAVLTNGSLLNEPGVRAELMGADLVLPSLDAATDAAFYKINRPLKSSLTEAYVEGLVNFSNEFKGEIWLEILILPGYNDDMENILALKSAVEKIKPQRIQLNTLDRPGAVEGLRAATMVELEKIVGILDQENIEIIAPPKKRQESKSYRTDVENALLETISRRPCTLQDMENILGLHINEINKYLGPLEESGVIEPIQQERGIFYQLKKA